MIYLDETLCSCQGAPRARALEAGCWKRAGARPAPWTRRLAPGAFGNLLFQVLPRKEVIQPHLPVRLPCYDFTPLTLHTFDASAPLGFGRRIRVQTTRVV